MQSHEPCPGAPLSHLRKIPSATSGSNKGVKIVLKALSGAIARHSGDGKFYAMPHNEARVGMMKIVVRETEARKASGRRTSTPDNSVSKHCCGRVRMAIPAPLLALSGCKI